MVTEAVVCLDRVLSCRGALFCTISGSLNAPKVQGGFSLLRQNFLPFELWQTVCLNIIVISKRKL